MGTITLSFVDNKSNKKNKTKLPTKEKVLLTYHGHIPSVPEYFSYITSDNKEVMFTDKSYMITKISSTKYIGKKTYVSKIPLTYINGKSEIKYEPEFFTYNDNEIYLDKPIYDIESNTYKGILEVVNLYDKEIKLYEE